MLALLQSFIKNIITVFKIKEKCGNKVTIPFTSCIDFRDHYYCPSSNTLYVDQTDYNTHTEKDLEKEYSHYFNLFNIDKIKPITI